MVRLILIRAHQLIVFLRIIVPHLHIIIKELALILQLQIRDHQLRRSQVEELQNSLLIFLFPTRQDLETIQRYHFLMSWIFLEINHLMSTPLMGRLRLPVQLLIKKKRRWS